MAVNSSGWYGVDLDGTLAHYTGWNGGAIGHPIPAMMQRVKRMIEEGKIIKIFTARADRPAEVVKIEQWCKLHGLPKLEVTNKKDHNMITCYDDRCVHVETNTGRILG